MNSITEMLSAFGADATMEDKAPTSASDNSDKDVRSIEVLR